MHVALPHTSKHFSSKWNKTTLDQENNLLRATTEAMSAIIGGADVLCLHPFNENTKEQSGSAMKICQKHSASSKVREFSTSNSRSSWRELLYRILDIIIERKNMESIL